LALLAAGAQTELVRDPAIHITGYQTVWISTAFVSAALAGAQMYSRSRRMHSGMSDEKIAMAVEQFLPSVVASLLVTIVLFRSVPSALWMLPGIWQVIFSLGIFSSCRFLPRPILAAGTWYLLTGLFCIALGDNRALSPWTMGIPFATGQLLVAGILFSAGQEVQEGGDES